MAGETIEKTYRGIDNLEDNIENKDRYYLDIYLDKLYIPIVKTFSKTHNNTPNVC